MNGQSASVLMIAANHISNWSRLGTMCASTYRITAHVLFYIFCVIWSGVCGVSLLISLCAPVVVTRWWARHWAQGVLRLAKWLLGIHMCVQGLENIPVKGKLLVASQHQSVWETLALTVLLPCPIFVLKASLMKIPMVGLVFVKLGMIPVQRPVGGSAGQGRDALIKAARQSLSKGGCSLIIFPEGTRVPVGQCRAYRSGVFWLAHALGLPTVPVALNAGRCWPRRQFFKNPGIIRIVFLPAFEPPLLPQDKQCFMNNLQSCIARAHQELSS